MRKHNPIYKRALMLAVPMMIQNGITNMVSLVDNIMVGQSGHGSDDCRFHCRSADLRIQPRHFRVPLPVPASTGHNITDSGTCTVFRARSASSSGSV